MMKATKTTTIPMPKGVTVADTKRATDYTDDIPYSESVRENIPTRLTIHYVQSTRECRRGKDQWMIETLHISNASRRSNVASTDYRTYALGVTDKQVYCIGIGPHITKSITVHVKRSNLARLMPLIELYRSGMNDANSIRDRRSTRIARTKQRTSRIGSWLDSF